MPDTGLSHLALRFVRNVRKDESVFSELLNVVKYVSDEVDGYLKYLVEPLLDDLEYVFARVGTADVSDDVLGVAVVNREHLNGLLFVSNLFL